MASNKPPFERSLNEPIQIFLKRIQTLGIVVIANITGLILCLFAFSSFHTLTVLLIVILIIFIISSIFRRRNKHLPHTASSKQIKIISIKKKYLQFAVLSLTVFAIIYSYIYHNYFNNVAHKKNIYELLVEKIRGAKKLLITE